MYYNYAFIPLQSPFCLIMLTPAWFTGPTALHGAIRCRGLSDRLQRERSRHRVLCRHRIQRLSLNLLPLQGSKSLYLESSS